VKENGKEGEKLYLQECDALWSGRTLLTYQRNLLPPSSGFKNKLIKQIERIKHQARVSYYSAKKI
jgi:hypothetical protein